MDYAPNPKDPTNRIISFYVFDKGGVRVTSADLDGQGNKFVPNLAWYVMVEIPTPCKI